MKHIKLGVVEPKVIQMEEILVGNRFRRVYDLNDEFCDSIRSGLIEPIVVRALPEGHESGKKYELAAGGRRHAAHEKIEAREIRSEVLPVETTELELRWVELQENIQRKSLEWTEEVELKKKVLELYKQAYPDLDHGEAVKQTASALGVSETTLREDIKLHEATQRAPKLKEAPTKQDAKKALRQAQERAIQRELAKRAEARHTVTGADALRRGLISCYMVKDTFEGMKELPDKSFDFIDLDPPYAIGYEGIEFGGAGSEVDTSEFREFDKKEYPELIGKVAAECARITRGEAWMVCWFSPLWFAETKNALSKAGWEVADLPLIWYKPGQGRTRVPHIRFTSDYEMAFYARKGKAQLVNQAPNAVFTCSPVKDGYHPTEKPQELLEGMYKNFVVPGQRIFSPFLGSGSILLAAANLGCKALGFDLSPVYRDSFIMRASEFTPKNVSEVVT